MFSFLKMNLEDKISFLNDIKIKTMIDGDYLETSGKINNVFSLKNKLNEYFIIVNFAKNDIFNENIQILYDSHFTPLGKLAFSVNKADKKVSFNYFFVDKNLRGQSIGQSMIDFLLDCLVEELGDFEIYTNPYSFDTSFNGIKGYDYESQYFQYRLEQFYLNNGFILTEEPKKYVFGEYDDIPPYTLTEDPCR